jgi:LDH2 family malate/lactate/ureidoglycolate dehydrogenase
MQDNHTFSVTELRRFIVEVFSRVGVAEVEGEIVADNLLKADLWGIGSHGISRFPVYLKRIEDGAVNPRPAVTITRPLPALLSVDGDNGLGSVVASKALDESILTAGIFGMATAGIRHSNHFGAAGYYCEIAARQNFVAIVLTDAPPATPAWGSKEPYFGTNPIAIGLPRRNHAPVIIDMATSIVARGKIIAAAKKGESIPAGWALDKDGAPTTNAQEALAGTLLPMAGPKGYALALAVEHLSGVLTGAAFGRDVAWQYGSKQGAANVGHIMILVRADAFLGLDEYHERTERFCAEIKGSEKAPGVAEIFLPGERERILEERLISQGIVIPGDLFGELEAIAAKYGVAMPT